jgi:hypothetical protein
METVLFNQINFGLKAIHDYPRQSIIILCRQPYSLETDKKYLMKCISLNTGKRDEYLNILIKHPEYNHYLIVSDIYAIQSIQDELNQLNINDMGEYIYR